MNIDRYTKDTKDSILKVVEKANNILLNSNMTEEEVLEVIKDIDSIMLVMAGEDESINDNNGDNIDNSIENGNNEDNKTDSKDDEGISENNKNESKDELVISEVKDNTEKDDLPNTGSNSIYLAIALSFTLLIGGTKLYKKN